MIDGYGGLSAYGDYGTYGASALERWVRSRRKKAKTRREKAQEILRQSRRAKRLVKKLPMVSAAARRAPIVRSRAQAIRQGISSRLPAVARRPSLRRAALVAAPALLIPGIGPMVSAGVLGLSALRRRLGRKVIEGGAKKGLSSAQLREMRLRAALARQRSQPPGPGAMVPSADIPGFATEGGVDPFSMPAAVEPEMSAEALPMEEAPSIPWLPILLGVAVLGAGAVFLKSRKGSRRSSPAPVSAPPGAKKKKRKKRRAA